MESFPPCAPSEPAFEIVAGAGQRLPIVLSSPHSGDEYPADLLARTRLDAQALRRSQDSFVDEIFAGAVELGIPLLKARFGRAYVDANREPYELDPGMFEDLLPDYVNASSPRVQVGLGTIPRSVASGADIYRGKLRFADAKHRIDHYYRPYHRALGQLIEATRARFGFYLLVDCHSMPSSTGPHDRRDRIDFVLGDCHGTACHKLILETAQRILLAKGYTVARNIPYAGGFTTAHYGRPHEGGHSLQIEINRNLYMDERRIRRKPFLNQLAQDMRDLIAGLGEIERQLLRPIPAEQAKAGE